MIPMRIMTDIFDNIALFNSLQEVKDYASERLQHHHHIQAIAKASAMASRPERTMWDDDCLEIAEWVESMEFLSELVTDERCPEWLGRQIVETVLSTNIKE